MNETIVSMHGICKAFPGFKALDNVPFELRSGEVMALLGEKSTLMKILSGVYTRESGQLTIFGKECGDLTTKQAQALGVAIIHQELNMCPHLTVAENMFLGREKRKGFLVDTRGMEEEAQRILSDLKIDISPSEIVGNLPVSKQQMVEIAKALSINAKVLIMDEPTSALTAKEIDELFRIIKRLRADGCGIVYISNRLEELQHIVDRVTIMRDGQYITDMNFADATMDEIITHMVGREIKEKFPRVECDKGEKIFEVKNLNAGRLVRNINFEVYAGEIVGFAGLMGAGRTETTRAIFGVDPKTSGEFIVDGKTVHVSNPMDAIKAGIVLAPEDRKKDDLCTKLPIRENIALPNLDMLCNGLGVVNKKKEDAMCDKAVADLHIKTPNVEVDAGSLSGGNNQEPVAQDYKIALITMDRVDQHWVTLEEGAMKAASELGVEVVNMSPNAKDDAQQIEQINSAVSSGCQAIVVAANGPDSVSSALNEAAAAGVKIVYVDSHANVAAEATFSTDNKAAGKTAGETMIAELEAQGINEGAIGIVNVNAATDSTVQREAGFREAFEGKGYTLLETQYGEGDAVKAAGTAVIVVGFDKSDAILGLIEDGFILATMAQNPDVMGYEGVKAAVAALNGENLGGAVTDTGVSVLTK